MLARQNSSRNDAAFVNVKPSPTIIIKHYLLAMGISRCRRNASRAALSPLRATEAIAGGAALGCCCRGARGGPKGTSKMPGHRCCRVSCSTPNSTRELYVLLLKFKTGRGRPPARAISIITHNLLMNCAPWLPTLLNPRLSPRRYGMISAGATTLMTE